MTAGRTYENLWDRMARAMRPTDASDHHKPWQMLTAGTVNIIGGGAGGTSMTDNNPFTPGGTSITPAGGYFGGRQIASGNAGAPALSASAILQVHVVAGGAGGGVANITVHGTAGNDVNVGFGSGAAGAAGNWAMPVIYASGFYATVNAVIGAANVIGQAGSVQVVGSVRITGLGGSIGAVGAGGSMGMVGLGGSVGVTQITSPWVVTGSVSTTGMGGSIGAVNLGGSVGVLGIGGSMGVGGLGGSIGVTQITSPWVVVGSQFTTILGGSIGAIGLGGSISAAMMTRGTANQPLGIGQASNNLGAWPNHDGGAWLPVMFPSGFYPTVNTAGGGGGGFASVAVYGSPAMPVYNVGSVHVVNAVGIQGSVTGIQTVNIASHVDTVNSAVRVNVVTGGAGGGNANLTTRGTGGTDYHVGYASNNLGAWPNYDGGAWLPVMFPSGFYPTVNTAGGGGGFASVAVYGSPANPVYNVGSVQVVNYGDTTNSAFRVNVVAGGAGGGVANLQVRGTGNADYYVGYASNNLGAWPNYAGGAWLPVMYPSGFYPTVNINGAVNQAGAPWSVVNADVVTVVPQSIWTVNLGLGTVNIGNLVSVTGSVGVTPLATFTVALDKIATVNLGLGTVNIGNIPAVVGSVGVTPLAVFTVNMGLGTVNVGNIPSIVGSVQVTPAAAFSLAGVTVVNPLGSLTATQWTISGAASGQFVVAGSAPASQRVRISSFQLVANGTIDMRWMSPSGVAISGSMRILPGAGFGMAGAIPNGPVLIGSQQSALYIDSQGTQNIGGIAVGWVE